MARALDLCAASLPAPLDQMMKTASAASQSVAITQVSTELNDRLSQEVAGDCKAITSGRYPFVRSSGNDVPTGDFGRLFGYGGELDAFFRENLASLVDQSRSTWRWREVGEQQVGMSPGVLSSFQAAARVREAFFPPGGQMPQVRFTLNADSMDSDIVRFVLELDGQRFEYRHDPPQPFSATWPGPSPGVASVRFEDRTGRGPSQSWQGPWAFFRLLDSAQLERRSETRYLVTFRSGGKAARVVLEASSIHNPFGRDVLERFRCAR
jgi:type VI secretion system protein ImpL